jgi:hypothetical protein
MLDFVDGRTAVEEFDKAYSGMWEGRRDDDWAALEARHPQVRRLIREDREEWDRLNGELIRDGALFPDELQKVLDGIFTDLDVLDRPNGITVDQLRANCKQAIAKLDELERTTRPST